jgi:predicted anti-sigma-YlaC factor YlaD
VRPISEDQDRRHPAAYRLDAVAAGDDDERVCEHMASCEDCAGYVSALRQEAQTFRDRRDADGYVTRALERKQRARRRAQVIGVAAPLLAAAAFLLFVGGRPQRETVVQSVEPSGPPESGEMRFKGELSVAVIRERNGRQERIVGSFGVRAGDGIRVEVSVDQEGPLTAGLLTDEADWIVLLAPMALKPGTHFSERAARFDETPTRATLLVGTPAAVDRARHTREFAGLVAWRVTSER